MEVFFYKLNSGWNRKGLVVLEERVVVALGREDVDPLAVSPWWLTIDWHFILLTKSAIQLCSEGRFINIWFEKVWNNVVQILEKIVKLFIKTTFLVHACFSNLITLKIHLHNPAQGRQSDSLRKRSGLLYIRMKFWMERRSSPERKVAWGTIE